MPQTYDSVKWADNSSANGGGPPASGAYAAGPLLVDNAVGDTTTGYASVAFLIGQHNQTDRARIAMLYDLGTAQVVTRVRARLVNAKFYTQSICYVTVGKGSTIANIGGVGGWQTNFTKSALAFDSAGTDTDFTQSFLNTGAFTTAARYWLLIAEVQLQGNFAGYQDNFTISGTDYRLYGTDNQLVTDVNAPQSPCARPAPPAFTAAPNGNAIILTGTY